MKRKTLFYGLLRIPIHTALKLFFKRKEVYGWEQVPHDKPLMFAANHQGTLMDGILIVASTNLHVASLARADIFKSKKATKFFNMFHVVPIYRARDGGNTVEKNKQVFKACYDYLKINGSFNIFPEGSQDARRHLRRFKKGVARIALGAEAENNFKLDAYVVPVGLNYEQHRGFRKDAVIHFGKPIKVSNYKDLYEENKESAFIKLTDDVRESIKPLILHIEDLNHYEELETYLTIQRNNDRYINKVGNLSRRAIVDKDQQRINKIESWAKENKEAYKTNMQNIKNYSNQLKENGYRDWLFADKSNRLPVRFFKFMVLLLTFPLYVYGLINCAASYQLVKVMLKKFLKEKPFLGTMKFLFGMISALLMLAQGILVSILFNNINIGLLYAISLPFAGIFWYYYNIAAIKLKAQLKFNTEKSTEKIQSLIANPLGVNEVL